MANVYYEKGKFSNAMASLKVLIAGPPKNELQKAARKLFLEASKKELARLYNEEKLEEFLKLFKENERILHDGIGPRVQFLLAQSLYGLNRHDEAILAFRQLDPGDLDPKEQGTYYLRFAESLRSSGNQESALEVLQKARKEPLPALSHQRAAFLLAEIYRDQSRSQDAYQLYDGLVKGERLLSDGEIAEIYFHMARILNAEGSYEKAREVLNRSIALVEKERSEKGLFLRALVELGESYRREGRHEKAAQAYQEAFRSGYGPEMDGYWEVKLRLADSYLGVGKTQGAERVLREIEEEGDPNLQEKVQMKLGSINLENQLKRLSIWKESGGNSPVNVKQ
jgi:tetratricopeptide (TPR) repeat protein